LFTGREEQSRLPARKSRGTGYQGRVYMHGKKLSINFRQSRSTAVPQKEKSPALKLPEKTKDDDVNNLGAETP